MRRAIAALVLAATPCIGVGAQQAPSSNVAWTRGATCYEVFVRSFQDSDGDGIGDLKGLIARLDYINDGDPRSQRDLGARCIWLMPVAESPSYHGYDVTDYYGIEKDYGTRDDFRRLVAESHKRGIKVLVDLVLNHSSVEHPFFQAAARDTASPYRRWYRWARTNSGEKTPWGADLWHKSPVRDEYYFGLFWSGMPDLDYSHPPVMEEAKKVARFWIDSMGVDGFRLDAIKHLVEEPGKFEHAAGTHVALREWATYLRSVKPDAYTVGEVWDNVERMLPYYPDQLTSHFAFEVADAIVNGVKNGSAKGLLEPSLRLQAAVPDQRWSPFLRNHDQPRTRTELGGDLAKTRLASAILLTMPGMPFLYYGEEIGMTGTKPDERIRTPMQWSRANHGGFTTGKPWQTLQPDSMEINVAAQEKDPRSLLTLHRRLVHLRDANPALGTGELVPLQTSNQAVGAWIRRAGERVVLAVANLGDAPRTGVAVASRERAVPGTRYRLVNLLGGAPGAALQAGASGRIAGWVPVRTLAPRELYLFELVATPARGAAPSTPASRR